MNFLNQLKEIKDDFIVLSKKYNENNNAINAINKKINESNFFLSSEDECFDIIPLLFEMNGGLRGRLTDKKIHLLKNLTSNKNHFGFKDNLFLIKIPRISFRYKDTFIINEYDKEKIDRISLRISCNSLDGNRIISFDKTPFMSSLHRIIKIDSKIKLTIGLNLNGQYSIIEYNYTHNTISSIIRHDFEFVRGVFRENSCENFIVNYCENNLTIIDSDSNQLVFSGKYDDAIGCIEKEF